MPPPGGGAGDMVKALEIINWILVNCFRKSNAADVRYTQFGSDLEKLDFALKKLQEVLSAAHLALDPFVDDAKYIAGDFVKTVKACKELFAKKERFKKKAGFLGNAKYAIWDHPQFEGLRGQLLFHSQTLNLVTASVDTDLLLRIYQDVSELLERQRSPGGTREIHRPRNLVPAWLDNTFKENVTLSPPRNFTNVKDIPLRDGCLALRQHFYRLSKHGIETHSGREQSILQYVYLLKCAWLIDVLKGGDHFDSRSPGEPLRRFLSNVEMEVYNRLRNWAKSKETPITEEELTATLAANNDAFLIWEAVEQRKRMLAWEPKEGEQKLAEISLADDERLIVFRCGPTTRRMVVVIETEDDVIQSKHQGEVYLDIRLDQFIPLYTMSTGQKDLRVLIYRQNVATPDEYRLADKRAAWTLQQAITGYKVRADERDVELEILLPVWSSPSSRKEQITGRAHAWAWEPLAQDSPQHVEEEPGEEIADLSSPSSRSFSFSRISRGSTYSMQSEPKSFARSSTSRGRPSTSQTSLPSIIERRRSSTSASTIAPSISAGPSKPAVVVGEPPIPPAIVFFATSENIFTCFHLNMTSDLFIDKSACDCGATDKQVAKSCCLMVIARHGKKNFKVQTKRWDLSPPSSGRPSPNNNTTSVESVTCMELRLKFPTPEKREDFYATRLEIYLINYQDDEKAYEKAKLVDKIRADRPKSAKDVDGSAKTEMYSLSSSPSNNSSRVSFDLPRIGNGSSLRLPYLEPTSTAPRQSGSSSFRAGDRE
ncbi:hypothetical protein QBC37DRAFT_432488 [Rhypophila decipiens]|uniref:Uncharacterized protein n=1 Tax=Rhypophila decipiens TaxID=261697 RepID=A0AAN7B2Q2_9PEZI|nr:hypothetical protein QBC37DRAFT_432488 [Rhypophila decipiens]